MHLHEVNYCISRKINWRIMQELGYIKLQLIVLPYHNSKLLVLPYPAECSAANNPRIAPRGVEANSRSP